MKIIGLMLAVLGMGVLIGNAIATSTYEVPVRGITNTIDKCGLNGADNVVVKRKASGHFREAHIKCRNGLVLIYKGKQKWLSMK